MQSGKKSSFGYGQKSGLVQIFGKDSPPPSSYRLKSDFGRKRDVGKSFGLPHSAYNRVHLEGVCTTADELPGPGTYDQKTMLGQNSRKFSFKSRIKTQDAAARNFPPPNCYNPDHLQTEQSRFDAVTFGVGGRGSVNGKILDTPGPGTYKLKSPFEAYRRLPLSSTQGNFFKKRLKSKRKGSKKRRRSQTPNLMEEENEEEEKREVENLDAEENEEEEAMNDPKIEL